MKFIVIALASLFCNIAVAASEKNINSWGVGAWTCESWTRSLNENNFGETAAVMSWVQGYLQGVNAGRIAGNLPIPVLPANDLVLNIVQATCKDAPSNSMIADVSARIWVALLKYEQEHKKK